MVAVGCIACCETAKGLAAGVVGLDRVVRDILRDLLPEGRGQPNRRVVLIVRDDSQHSPFLDLGGPVVVPHFSVRRVHVKSHPGSILFGCCSWRSLTAAP